MKTLIFLCDNYPISAREFFVDDEMRVIADRFEKVIVLTSAQNQDSNLHRYIPDNIVVEQFSRKTMEDGKWKSLWKAILPIFLQELFFAIRLLPAKQWISALKIMYVELHRSKNVQQYIYGILKKHNLSVNQCIFYSYWHDYKAMALALLRRENPNIKCFARAHRWDVFAEENNPPYLPFKNFIIENLTKTISISDAGKKAFETYLNKDLTEKVVVSRLGKFNDRTPLLHKTNDDFVICSCSNINPMKRVHLIVEILSKMKVNNITWIHFGAGYEECMKKIYETIERQYPQLKYELKGMVSNDCLLDYYAQNHIDLFINVSDNEGIPVSIMEALSAGIPVVATNVGGTSEAVNNHIGFLIERDFDINVTAQLLDNYLMSPSGQQMAYRKKAYEFWKNNYEAQMNYTNFVSNILC